MLKLLTYLARGEGNVNKMSWGTELWDQYDQIAHHTQKGIDFLEKYSRFADERYFLLFIVLE